MNNLRILLALALSFLPLANASAGNGTITTKDAAGVTRTFSIVTDGSGNFIARQVICDQSAAATCASVGTAGSPSTNAVTVQAVTLGAGTAANAMRVELPTDGTGKVTAAQATAANLNATVVGTGTFATQSAITAASGSIASGALSSGSVASGAFASGAVSSGAFASGSIASGALAAGSMVDLLTVRGTKNAGTAAANSLLAGGVYNSTPLTLTDTQQASLQADANGYLKVNVVAGGAGGGAVTVADGADVTQGAKADAAGCTGTVTAMSCYKQIHLDLLTPPSLGTTGGWTPLKLAALTNTAVAIKGTAGQLGKLYCYNPNATVAYIQIYNVVAGSVSVGSTASLQSYGIPPTNGSGYTLSLIGDQYTTAISAAATTTTGGSTAPSSAVDCNVSYN